MKRIALLASAAVLATLPAAAFAQEEETATAELTTANGDPVGTVTVVGTPNGVIITANITGLDAGTYAFHVHETGICEGPAFETAGGHFNPTGREHGFENPNGPHAGDLPNLHVPDTGMLTVELFATELSLAEGDEGFLLDDDGAAFIVHAMHDDYMTDPAGEAGDRIACGVLAEGPAG